jgi:hypothetical protein
MLKDLAFAVLRRAFEDLQLLHSEQEYVKIGRSRIYDAASSAEAFLTHTDDEWSDMRQLWCEQAGLDAEKIRQRALNILQEAQRAKEAST